MDETQVNGTADVTDVETKPARRGRGPAKKSSEVVELIKIPPLMLSEGIIPIRGVEPLIVNNFSSKSKNEMLDKQMGKPKQKKAPKVPTDDFLGSLYVMDGKPKLVTKNDKTWATGFTPGFPANAIKKAAVAACTAVDGVFKTEARMAFHVKGFMLEILDPKTKKPAVPWMRDDMVRLQGPSQPADIRFRACFDEWMIKVPVQFNARMIDLARIAHLFNNAGFGVGIGEWRPECDGNFGRFTVEM